MSVAFKNAYLLENGRYTLQIVLWFGEPRPRHVMHESLNDITTSGFLLQMSLSIHQFAGAQFGCWIYFVSGKTCAGSQQEQPFEVIVLTIR